MTPSGLISYKIKTFLQIGHCFIKLKEYQEAINFYEEVLKFKKIPVVLYNLIICYYTLNDKTKIKNSILDFV